MMKKVKITVSWDETLLNWVDGYNYEEVTHNRVTHKLLSWFCYVLAPWTEVETLP
jgi:hypothetical protein